MIVSIHVLTSHYRGGSAVAHVDTECSGLAITRSKWDRADVEHLTYTGVLRLGPIGEWLYDTMAGLIRQGTQVRSYELTVDGDTVRAVEVDASAAKGRAA